MDEIAVGGGEDRGVPIALRLAAGHDEVLAAGLPRHGFDETRTTLVFFDLINALALPPVPTLPGHLAVARHRVRHRSHAAAEQRRVVGRKSQAGDATAIVMGL